MDIDTMLAGREMDALVGEKVMGLEGVQLWEAGHQFGTIGFITMLEADEWVYREPTSVWEVGHALPVPHYSTDIAAAWEVVEALYAREYWIRIKTAMDEHLQRRGWSVDIGKFWNREGFGIWAENAPLAICRSALRAISYDG